MFFFFFLVVAVVWYTLYVLLHWDKRKEKENLRTTTLKKFSEKRGSLWSMQLSIPSGRRAGMWKEHFWGIVPALFLETLSKLAYNWM